MTHPRNDKPTQNTLGKIAEVAIRSQMDEVEELNVDLQAHPLQLVQGEVESVAIAGEGIVVQNDLRASKLDLQTNKVAIDPLKAVFGEIVITQPTQATAEIVLTDSDINRAFSSEYVLNKLQGLTVSLEGKPVALDVKKANLTLPGGGKIVLDSEIFFPETGELRSIAFSAIPTVACDGRKVELKEICIDESIGTSQDLILPLIQEMQDLLNFQNFDLQGMTLQLDSIRADLGKFIMKGHALIEEFPESN